MPTLAGNMLKRNNISPKKANLSRENVNLSLAAAKEMGFLLTFKERAQCVPIQENVSLKPGVLQPVMNDTVIVTVGF